MEETFAGAFGNGSNAPEAAIEATFLRAATSSAKGAHDKFGAPRRSAPPRGRC
jgi:hypothetical protein